MLLNYDNGIKSNWAPLFLLVLSLLSIKLKSNIFVYIIFISVQQMHAYRPQNIGYYNTKIFCSFLNQHIAFILVISFSSGFIHFWHSRCSSIRKTSCALNIFFWGFPAKFATVSPPQEGSNEWNEERIILFQNLDLGVELAKVGEE